MIKVFTDFFTDLKDDFLKDLHLFGIFPAILIRFLFLLVVILYSPLLLVGLPFYLLNEKSKSWGTKSLDPELFQVEVLGDG